MKKFTFLLVLAFLAGFGSLTGSSYSHEGITAASPSTHGILMRQAERGGRGGGGGGGRGRY